MWAVIRLKPFAAVQYRQGAAEMLGYFGDHAPVPALGEALRDPRLEVGDMAARSLSRLGRRGVLVLAEALSDPDARVRSLACHGLSQARASAIDVAPTLIQHLDDPDDNVRQQVAGILNQLGQPAVPALLDALSDPDPSIRVAAVSALGTMGIGARSASPTLSALAEHDPDEGVRRRAQEVLPMINAVRAAVGLEPGQSPSADQTTPQ
jgi:HEAT repeat protein